ncbi:hypothetical protein IAQ61_009902 [Plenodomus lingam]|uniref:uncharacterized protein n=1 Tax=Leptosphaeria maculans TaxID=5022 RepID=UPI0033194DF0|nr:hypothetical protein IAQ61_009902 [Plenodomus lingam]
MGFSTVSITCIAILLTYVYIRNRIRAHTSQIQQDAEAEKPGGRITDSASKPARLLRSKLVAALPHIVITPETRVAFEGAVNAYWDQKACEVVPSCVVQPRNVWELAKVVKVLRREFDLREKEDDDKERVGTPLFAVRAGGHSPVVGASSVDGGVLIDLALLKEVAPAQDGKTVAIGAGCKWIDVYKVLDDKAIAVAGGRNSAVGVAGLTLGGGLSFFSPRFGFVCSNMIEYELVLADGTITTASATRNPDLWRALKGGSNNFGIVTRFVARSFPCKHIWSGFLYLPSWQAQKVLAAFYDHVNKSVQSADEPALDENAAGPLVGFTYLQQLGIQAIAVNLAHTNPPEGKTWPACWQASGFSKLQRFWSTCTVRTVTSATDEMSVLNPPGRRQEFATTTVKNDAATLEAVHKVYRDTILVFRTQNIKKLSWTLGLQPLVSDWARTGDPNVLGLESMADDEPLVLVSFTVNWAVADDDEFVHSRTRRAVEQIDGFANEHGTSHPYRHLNYCASWQDPLAGYARHNKIFLQHVSRTVDPDGLFQTGCTGGFKLGL